MNEKKFDCVKMKHDIQKKLAKEVQGLSCEERMAKFKKDIQANPILAKVWNQSRRIESPELRHESSAD